MVHGRTVAGPPLRGRSKSAGQARLKRPGVRFPPFPSRRTPSPATSADATRTGVGLVVIASQLTYLVGVMCVARTLWLWDVPLQAAVMPARRRISEVCRLEWQDFNETARTNVIRKWPPTSEACAFAAAY